jgi:hypothetical protein
MMHEREKSDPAVVAVKPANNAEQSASLRRLCIRAAWPAPMVELMLVGCEIIEDNLPWSGALTGQARQP